MDDLAQGPEEQEGQRESTKTSNPITRKAKASAYSSLSRMESPSALWLQRKQGEHAFSCSHSVLEVRKDLMNNTERWKMEMIYI